MCEPLQSQERREGGEERKAMTLQDNITQVIDQRSKAVQIDDAVDNIGL